MAWGLQVEGTIPKDLVGTYYRNGPGMQVSLGADKETSMSLLCVLHDEGCMPVHYVASGSC